MKSYQIPELNYLSLDSPLDSENLSKLQLLIDERLKYGSKYFVFDFKEIDYLSSSGIRLFIRLQKHLRLFDGFLVILAPQKRVKDLLQTAELWDLLKVNDSFEEVIKEFN